MSRGTLLGLAGLILVGATLVHWQTIGIFLGISIGFYALSGLPWKRLGQRWRYPLGLVAVLLLLLPWAGGDTLLWQWGSLRFTQEGLLRVVQIGGRLGSLVTLTLVMLASQSLTQTLAVGRRWGLSGILVEMIALTCRYVEVLGADWQQMQRAIRLRGGTVGIPTFVPLLGTLLVRSVEQSERVAIAMRLRGYGQPLLGDPEPWQGQERMMLVSLWGLGLGLLVLDRWGGWG